MKHIKSIWSRVLVFMLLIQLVNPVVFPLAHAESEVGVLQFSDDFSGGMGQWTTTRQQFHPIGDEPGLYSDNRGYCSAAIAGETTRWGNSTLTVRARFSQAKSDAMLLLNTRENKNQYFTLILRVGTEKSFRYFFKNGTASKSETLLSGANYALEENTDYDIKLVSTDEKVSVYVKRADEAAYMLAGSAAAAFSESGSVSFSSRQMIAKIVDFKIYNDDPGEFYFEKKIVQGKTGATQSVAPVNQKNLSVTYTSENPECVSVDADGTLHFLSAGNTVITAAATDGNISYQDSCDVFCYDPVRLFGFNQQQKTLYVGEVLNLCAVMRPDSVENKRIKWSCSNDNAEVFGNLDNEKSIQAKKPGTSVITMQSMDNPALVRRFTVTILPLPEEKLTARFSEGENRKIPQYFFGMHQSPLDQTNTVADKETILNREEKYAGYFRELHLDFTRFMLNQFNWKTGKYQGTPASYPSYTLKNIYTASRLAEIPYMIVAADTDTADDIAGMVREIRKVTDQPIFIEMGNETYDYNAYAKYFPTIESFMDRVREAYPKIKAIDPSIKVAIPLRSGIIDASGDPNTHGGRVAVWDKYMMELKDYCDAVVMHSYSGVDFWEVKSTRDILNGQAQHMAEEENTAKTIFKNFGKEIWISEFGDLPGLFGFAGGQNDDKYFWPQSESERARLQYAKSVGNAVSYAARLMNYLNDENITMASYHYFNDPQSFGVIQDDTKLPNWYMFQKIGEILSGNEYYYKLSPEEENQVTAYGFGTESELQTIVFSNMTNQTAETTVGDRRLKKVWSYGSDNPLPDYGNYTESYTSLPSVIPLPEEHSELGSTISLAPYSITVCEVTEEVKLAEPDVDIHFQTGTEIFDGATISNGGISDGVFSLNSLGTITTSETFDNGVIEFDYMFVNGSRLDISMNIKRDEDGKMQYYNYLYFSAGNTLYNTFRMISVNENGRMGDNPFLSNHEIALENHVRYRIKIVKKMNEVSFYVMRLDEENPEYQFCGRLVHPKISNEKGEIVLQSMANGACTLIPYQLRIYHPASIRDMYARNLNVTSQNETVSVGCDVYSFAASENAKAIAAVYDGGRLIGVRQTDVGFKAYKTPVQFEPLPGAGTDRTVRIYLWSQDMTRILSEALEQ